MGDRYVKSDISKKILYIDANNVYGHSMSQLLPGDKIQMWPGHPNLYMNKLEEIINTSDGSNTGYFLEIDLRYPDNITKNKDFSILFRKKMLPKDK